MVYFPVKHEAPGTMTDLASICIEFQWTFGVDQRSQSEGQSRAAQLTRRLLFFGGPIVGIVLFTRVIESVSNWSTLSACFGAVAVVAGMCCIARLQARRRFLKRPDANMKLAWRATPEALVASGGEVTTTMRWTDFDCLRRTRSGVVLFPRGVERFYFLPESAFPKPSSLDRFIDFARNGGIRLEGIESQTLNDENG